MEMLTLELICFSPSRIRHRVGGVIVNETATKFFKISLLVCKQHSMRCVSEKNT